MNGHNIQVMGWTTQKSKQLETAHIVLQDPFLCTIVLKNPNWQLSEVDMEAF
jgi:hypothetical protein